MNPKITLILLKQVKFVSYPHMLLFVFCLYFFMFFEIFEDIGKTKWDHFD